MAIAVIVSVNQGGFSIGMARAARRDGITFIVGDA